MTFHLRKLFAAFLVVFLGHQVQAVPPTLSIQPQDYNYDLSITAVLVENCVELQNSDNLLMAYVEGQLRGYVHSSTLVGNRHMAFLTVYSNKPSGDTITFRLYNANTDKIVPVKTKLLFQDDAIYGNPSIPQEMQTNNRPTNLQLSTWLIPENGLPNNSFSTISAEDLDLDNTLSYTLVLGEGDGDNALFKTVGNQLQYSKLVNTSVKDTFMIRLSASDNFGCAVEKAFALVVDKVNDAPTGLEITDSTFFENVSGPTVGQFIPIDPDVIDRFSYALVAGDGDEDNGQFTIIDSLLLFKSTANFEAKNNYSIRVQLTDIGGLTFERVFTLYVKDKNDPPTNIVLSNNKVFENEPATQLVAKLYTVDEDTWDRYEYTFANIGTNDNFTFTISHDTLRATKVFDFETKNSYVVYLTSTDSSGVAVTKPFTITIKDTLDAPTGLEISNTTVLENAPKKTLVGVLSTVDANISLSRNYTYTLVAGKGSANNASFTIANDSLYSNEVLDFETQKDYSVRIRTSLVNGMYFEKEFAITVVDIPSTGLALSNLKVFENEPHAQFVAKISTITQDTGDAYVYTFGNVGTNDNFSFTLSRDTLWANKVFDYETKSSYLVYLTSTSRSGLSFTQSFTISILDTLDQPTDLVLEHPTIDENRPIHTFVGTLKTVDANTQPVKYDYAFATGTGDADNGKFQIVHDSLFSAEQFNFERVPNYSIRVRSTLVNQMFVEKAFVVQVVNNNEPPTYMAMNKDSVPENTPDSMYVSTFSVVDEDVVESFRYALVSGNNDTHNQQFVFKGNSLFLVRHADYEKNVSYQIRVRVTDKGGLFLDSALSIRIGDVNEPPRIVIQTYQVSELASIGTEIGIVDVKDVDRGQHHTFQLLTATSSFSIHPATGALVLSGGVDYEKTTEYAIQVKATDSGNPAIADSVFLRIQILDEIEDDNLPSADFVSPNDDGQNDVWKITNVELYKDYSLKIVDENSQLVYSVGSNYANDWDAKLHGKPIPNGVYYYVLKGNSDGKLFKGYITVLR